MYTRNGGLAHALGLLGAVLGAFGCQPSAPAEGGAEGEENAQGLASDTMIETRPTYLGLYRHATGETPTLFDRSETQFLEDMRAQQRRDFEMKSLTSHTMNGEIRYSAIWWPHAAAGLPDQFVTIGRTHDQFVSQYNDLTRGGWRMAHVSTTVVGSAIRYSAIFNRGSGDHTPGVQRTQQQFDADWRFWRDRGRRLACLSSSVLNGQVYYTGVYVPDSARFDVVNDVDINGMINAFNDRWNQGLRLYGVATFVRDEVVRYTGLFATTGDAWISYGQPEAGFIATQDYERPRGTRAFQIHASHVESLAINRLPQLAKNIFEPVTAGFAITVLHRNSRWSDVSGRRRTSVDPPEEVASTSARVNSASVSKTATAIGIMQALSDRNLTPSSRVAPFFPRDWQLGQNMDSLTFHELLSHRSGLRRGNQTDRVDYFSLRNMIASGRNGPTANPDYLNANFALFRIILPYMRGLTDGSFDKDEVTSARFLAHMNTSVFSRAGIATVAAKPTTDRPTLFYPRPANSSRGILFGDDTKTSGGAGFELSSDDIAQLLRRRADGTILDSASRLLMDTEGYGWDAFGASIRHGTFQSKGGFLFGFTSDGREAHVNTLAVSISNGVHVGMVINSATGESPFDGFKRAYDLAWVPVY